MRLDELGDLLQRRVPDRVARRRQEIVDRRGHAKVEVAREARVDDHGLARRRAGEERERVLRRPHRRRAADPLRSGATLRLDERLQPLERHGEVAAALRSHQRVDLVDDDEPRVGERGAEATTGEQDVE